MSDPAPSMRRPRQWLWIFGVLLLLLIAAMIGSGFLFFRHFYCYAIEPPLLRANADQLHRTFVAANLDAPIKPGQNLLWCSTLQLVWNEACRHAGGDLHFEDEPPVTTSLNRKMADASDVEAEGLLMLSGQIERGIVKEIHRKLNEKFGGQAESTLLDHLNLPASGYLAYACLFRQLPFERPLERYSRPFPFGETQVLAFGLWNSADRTHDLNKAEQVVVLDYGDPNDFIVELKPKDAAERIVLAKITPAETLEKTIETVRAREASSRLRPYERALAFNEVILTPILYFDLLREYHEFRDRIITTSGPLYGQPCALAQSINFRLDEGGAILRSEAALAVACAPSDKPRQLLFDRPFLILLERRGAKRPYFALWVDNTELLTPWK